VCFGGLPVLGRDRGWPLPPAGLSGRTQGTLVPRDTVLGPVEYPGLAVDAEPVGTSVGLGGRRHTCWNACCGLAVVSAGEGTGVATGHS
jgi:hypothetical protein